MCEVTSANFSEKYEEISESLKTAKFISLDLEFSALYPIKNKQPSLFDSPSERYAKVRKNIEKVVPLQVGLTAFSFDPNRNAYKGKSYTFYVKPASFQNLGRSFYFRADTLDFLALYGFDFNKFAYSGIPFINKHQENELRNVLFSEGATEKQANCVAIVEDIINVEGTTLQKWLSRAKVGDKLTIPTVVTKCKNDKEALYFIQKYFRMRHKNLWTTIENSEFVVKLLTDEQYKKVSKQNDLETELLHDLLGFTRLFRLLVSLQKPIIGHNMFQDIALMINSFGQPLPQSYTEFKKLSMQLFPTIFDTKVLTYDLKNLVPEEKRWLDTGLNKLFDYFKNGIGRHLSNNSPAIEIENSDNNYGQFHEAGWDSFCAGYVFIRLAHLNICKNFPVSKTFVPSELIGGLNHLKNYVNVIRGSTSSIRLDGEDPKSTRPPYLVVESVKNKTIDVVQVASILSGFGFVEVRKFPIYKRRALVAVDNFGNARRILSNFSKVNKDFRIKQYNVFRHSPILQACVISGIAFSSALLFWVTCSLRK